jgi:glycogen operon protein
VSGLLRRIGDIVWLTPAGQEIDWHAPDGGAMAVFLNGDAVEDPYQRGTTLHDDSFLFLFNARGEPVTFTLPGAGSGVSWEVVVDTARAAGGVLEAGAEAKVTGRCAWLLRLREPVRTVSRDSSSS